LFTDLENKEDFWVQAFVTPVELWLRRNPFFCRINIKL